MMATQRPAYLMDAPGGVMEIVLEGLPHLWWTIPLAVLAGGVVAWSMARRRRDHLRHGPEVRMLAAGSGLSRGDLRRLDRLAGAAGLDQAGGLLLSRGLFDHCCQCLRPSEAEGPDAATRSLRKRLFDQGSV